MGLKQPWIGPSAHLTWRLGPGSQMPKFNLPGSLAPRCIHRQNPEGPALVWIPVTCTCYRPQRRILNFSLFLHLIFFCHETLARRRAWPPFKPVQTWQLLWGKVVSTEFLEWPARWTFFVLALPGKALVWFEPRGISNFRYFQREKTEDTRGSQVGFL